MPACVEDALQHPARVNLLALLRETPGARLADLAFRLNTSRNTIEYHLFQLRRHEAVERRGLGWFIRGDGRAASPVRAYGAGRRIFDLLSSGVALTVTAIGRALALHPSHVMYHLRRFEGAGLVTTVKRGRSRLVMAMGPAKAAAEPFARPADTFPLKPGCVAVEQTQSLEMP